MSPHILWETLKYVVRGETIKYCALKKKKLIQQRLSLEDKSLKRIMIHKKGISNIVVMLTVKAGYLTKD